MPTKALLESSHRYHALKQVEAFGVMNATGRPDPVRIWRRKDDLIKEFADYRGEQLRRGDFELIRGEASFLNGRQVRVRDGDERRVLEAKSFIVATGSEIAWPAIDGLEEIDPLTSDTALVRPYVPKSLIVLGAGAVSLEFAQFYAHLGAQVTLLQRSLQIARDFDADVAGELELELVEQGIEVKKGVRLIKLEREESGKCACFEWEGRVHRVVAEEVFHGLGRRPAVGNLCLEAAGLRVGDGGGVMVNAMQQSTVENIFAAGDVTGQDEVVHVAVKAGEIAGRNACAYVYGDERFEPMPWEGLGMRVIFTQPEVACVGLTEREAMAQGRKIVMASHSFSDHGKSMIYGSRHGFVKLVADGGSGEILGAAVVGPCGSDLIHEIVPCLYFRAKAQDLAAMPHYHPTLAEIWTYPAEEIVERVRGGGGS
jgi:pyruvate/2-oxoglutarate dehydrogenase complex dihydrolipoamide dehydrogenase (E3) component